MDTHSFSVMKAVDFSFVMFARHFWFLLAIVLANAAVQLGLELIRKQIEMSEISIPSDQHESVQQEINTEKVDSASDTTIKEHIMNKFKGLSFKDSLFNLLLAVIFFVITLLATTIFNMGGIRVALDLYDYDTSSWQRFFQPFPLFFTVFFAQLVFGFICITGLVLFIIPGIYWGLKYSLYEYVIIDRSCGVFEGFSASGFLTNGHKWRILLFLILYLIINTIAGYIPFIGKFCVAILELLSYLSLAYIFRTLQAIKQNQE